MGTEGSEFFVLASLYLPDMPLPCWYYAVASNVLVPLLIGHMPPSSCVGSWMEEGHLLIVSESSESPVSGTA